MALPYSQIVLAEVFRIGRQAEHVRAVFTQAAVYRPDTTCIGASSSG